MFGLDAKPMFRLSFTLNLKCSLNQKKMNTMHIEPTFQEQVNIFYLALDYLMYQQCK